MWNITEMFYLNIALSLNHFFFLAWQDVSLLGFYNYVLYIFTLFFQYKRMSALYSFTCREN